MPPDTSVMPFRCKPAQLTVHNDGPYPRRGAKRHAIVAEGRNMQIVGRCDLLESFFCPCTHTCCLLARTCRVLLAAAVLLIGHRLQPVDSVAVQIVLNRDV